MYRRGSRAMLDSATSSRRRKNGEALALALGSVAAEFISAVIDAARRSLEAETKQFRPFISHPWELGVNRSDWKLASFPVLKKEVLARFEHGYVTSVLRAANGNISLASRMAGVDRKHFWRLLQRSRARHPQHVATLMGVESGPRSTSTASTLK